MPLLAVAIVLASGLFLLAFGRAIFGVNSEVSVRMVDGDYLGTLPRPVGPSLFDPLADLFKARPDYKLMAIKRIPPIVAGGGMPHPYVGPCTNCHLYVGGPGPGSQYKTPVGAVLEQLSRLHKLGPPIRPNAEIPHPPAGRCIKCHDIVVKVPIESTPGGYIWQP
ncbi:Magnetosome protein MamT [uncultured Gammaproteobacteria bacterium]